MQTFKLDLRHQVTAIVPEALLQEMLKEASGHGLEKPTVFLAKLYEEHTARLEAGVPEDESLDTFALAIVTNAVRKQTQHGLALFLVQAGCGARTSPVEVLSAVAVQPRSDSNSGAPGQHADKVEQVPGNLKQLSQGAAVLALQEQRYERDFDADRVAHDIAYSHSEVAQG